MNNLFKKICLLVMIVLLTFSLSGCKLLSFIFNSEEPQEEVKVEGFDFADYNTLEIVVSDTEKYVLTVQEITEEDEGKEFSGIGELIKDDVKYPIKFFTILSKAKTEDNGFYISYDKDRIYQYNVDFPTKYDYIVLFINDRNNPRIRYSRGYDVPLQWKKEQIPVTCNTYNTEIPQEQKSESIKAWESFITVQEDEKVVYVCEEGNFRFAPHEGVGKWITKHGREVIIRLEFEERQCRVVIYSQNVILSANAYPIDSNTVKLYNISGSMFEQSVGELILEKRQVE